MRDEVILKVACRRCGADLPVGTKFCGHCGATQKVDAVPMIFIVLLICSSFLLMSSSFVTVKQTLGQNSRSETPPPPVPTPAKAAPAPTAPKDFSQSAYYAAKRFVLEKYPQAKRISELHESTVEQNGKTFTVTLYVDGADGVTLVRNVFRVKLDYDNGNWKLGEIAE